MMDLSSFTSLFRFEVSCFWNPEAESRWPQFHADQAQPGCMVTILGYPDKNWSTGSAHLLWTSRWLKGSLFPTSLTLSRTQPCGVAGFGMLFQTSVPSLWQAGELSSGIQPASLEAHAGRGG